MSGKLPHIYLMTAMVKTERLEARVDKHLKALIEEAAELAGTSVTSFIISSCTSAAQEALKSQRQVTLDWDRSHAFVDALLDAPKPNEPLLRAANRHKERVRA